AADTEYDWPWYTELIGAMFRSHPHIQPATITVEQRTHPSTRHLDSTWTRTDEWYDFRDNPRPRVDVLMRLDPASYEGSVMPDDHPIAWCHELDGVRAFYTAGGHTAASYAEPAFLEHLNGALHWAARRAADAPN
ncbi:MAG: ThuA domain-containing protein, partial [Phycisphaerales bacterium]|nr:ThuA domain-containing protein [Phycisphaerales bacterium]